MNAIECKVILNRLQGALQIQGIYLDRVNLVILRNDAIVNAFANWKWNKIVVTTGLLNFVDTFGVYAKDVMSAVLGHEISHIIHRHEVREPHPLFHFIAGLITIAEPWIGIPLWLIGIDEQLSYNRMQEKLADTSGMRIASAAGYNQFGSILIHNRLCRLTGQSTSLLRSHPSPCERVQYLLEGIDYNSTF